MTLKELEGKVADVTLKHQGDWFEQSGSSLVTKHFPSYEKFWRVFVYPYRVEITYADKKYVRLNQDLPHSHEAVCIYNYSIFRTWTKLYEFLNTARIQKQLGMPISRDFFDICFSRLAIGYNQIRQFVGALYFLVQNKSGDNIKIKNWEKKYEQLKKNNYSGLTLILPNMVTTIGIIEDSKEKVHNYRNLIIHGPIQAEANYIILNPKSVTEYTYWSEVFKYAYRKDGNPRKNKFVTKQYLIIKYVNRFSYLVEEFLSKAYEEIINKFGANDPFNNHLLNLILLDPPKRNTNNDSSNSNYPGTSHSVHTGSSKQ